VGEAIGLETLHAAAFVVDADQHVGPHLLDVGAERGELGAILPVAGEQDQAASQRVFEAQAVGRREAGAGDIEDDRGMLVHDWITFVLRTARILLGAARRCAHLFFSTTTKLAA
jgi:hypothetical protein